MKRLLILLGVFVFLPVFLLPADELIFEEPFKEINADSYVIWGTADPFNRVEPYEGKLELEGSNGFEAFGIYFTPEFDLANGPLRISFDLERNSVVPGSEICLWFINQYLPLGSPWMEGDFVRIGFFSTHADEIENAVVIQETSPEQRGMGTLLDDVGGAFEMGKPFHVDFTVSESAYSVMINGEEVSSGSHELPETAGYIHIHDWNSMDAVDYVYNFKVYQ
jgi:hypothetical protein